MSCSAIFILDLKGNMSCIEKFMPLLVEKEDEGIHSPVLQSGDVSYTYIKHMNLYQLF
uniref:Uncharacterized protein n=1 Tax=Heterorhabditis bacteriophora TaxID=37862 RepID=A0A1I7WTG2_HETBA